MLRGVGYRLFDTYCWSRDKTATHHGVYGIQFVTSVVKPKVITFTESEYIKATGQAMYV